jgi:hypothetical protein
VARHLVNAPHKLAGRTFPITHRISSEMKHLGKLTPLRRNAARITKIIEVVFEVVDPGMWAWEIATLA